MCSLQLFSDTLQNFLIGNCTFNCNNFIKFHSKKLRESGDFSFSLNLIKEHLLKDSEENLLKKLTNNEIDKEEFIQNLVQICQSWILKVSNYKFVNDNLLCGYFDKNVLFSTVIRKVIEKKDFYGSHKLYLDYKFEFNLPFNESELKEKQLHELRMFVFQNALQNLLNFKESMNNDSTAKNIIKIELVYNKISSTTDKIPIMIGPLVNKKDSKKLAVTTAEFHRKRAIDLRLMAEHKYGLRMTDNWQELFNKLGEAAAVIELLQNKICQATIIDFNDHTVSSSKGASFILYNCGRLSTLFKHFEQKVSDKLYPKLTDCIDDIDFNRLKEPEEWELIYVFVARFPMIIENCIKNLFKSEVNLHQLCSFLSNMCSVFSVYYSRVRILTEPREHLFPVLFARLFLLRAVETVLHNGLKLLNIQPVKQM